ncbi:hypothetical protein Glove_50g116 [Diversispora epigaea]|uniref:Cation/H+ exchanger domain-containing protein n=1 Tax=Diversispora epigaea TaxID=1348612 RepID=A0A397JKP7_9GLOM|nr:hypothetical protein Glove_50g116 [Diversispora epigaea]
MLFFGLRGAVAFALAAGLQGDNASAMRTPILVVVVLNVIVFGVECSIESNGTGSSNNTEHHNLLSRAIPPVISFQTPWFISFDDRFFKPLFTRQKHIDERWRNGNVDRRQQRRVGDEDYIVELNSSSHNNNISLNVE